MTTTAAPDDRSNPAYAFSSADFDEVMNPKFTAAFHGPKGVGKTTTAMSAILENPTVRVGVLSFDRTAKSIKYGMYKDDPRIRIIDATKYYKDSIPELVTRSAAESINYIDQSLTFLNDEFQPHIVLLDATEVLEQMAEMKMRHMHGLAPSQGFPERNWWKDRSMIVRGIVRHSRDVAGVGLFLSMHSKMDELQIENGQVMVGKKGPNWMDILMRETEIVVECNSDYSAIAKKMLFRAVVESSKVPDVLATGQVFDLTDAPRNFRFGTGFVDRVRIADGIFAGQKTPVPKVTVGKKVSIPAPLPASAVPAGASWD